LQVQVKSMQLPT